MLRHLFSAIYASIAIALLSQTASAATVTGTAAWQGEYAMTVSSSDLQYGDGRPYSDQEVLLICVDVQTTVPPDGPVSFNAGAGTSVLRGGAGELGIAAIHWLFDQYYLTYFKGGIDQHQWAFQYAMWEIGNDFTGDVSSISASEGLSTPALDPFTLANSEEFVNAYETIYQGLVSALPSLSSSYRSSRFMLDMMSNNVSGLQDMVAVIERAAAPQPPAPVPVPLDVPVIFMSLLMGGLAFAAKRKTR